MIVIPVPDGSKGFDCNTKLTSETCKTMISDQFAFVVRYTSLGDEQVGDLDKNEVEIILSSGLGLMIVQHVRYPGWHPTASLGTQYGQATINNILGLGISQKFSVFVDLEGCADGTTSDDVEKYINAWATEVGKSFKAEIYVGDRSILNSMDLYNKLIVTGYWKSESEVPDVAVRGYQMFQTAYTSNKYPISIDMDVVQTDKKGDTPLMLINERRQPSNIQQLNKNLSFSVVQFQSNLDDYTKKTQTEINFLSSQIKSI